MCVPISASCQGIRAAALPLAVIASWRARTNSSLLGPDFGTASSPHGTRASRALGETNSTARGVATHSVSSCQPGEPISNTPRM